MIAFSQSPVNLARSPLSTRASGNGVGVGEGEGIGVDVGGMAVGVALRDGLFCDPISGRFAISVHAKVSMPSTITANTYILFINGTITQGRFGVNVWIYHWFDVMFSLTYNRVSPLLVDHPQNFRKVYHASME